MNKQKHLVFVSDHKIEETLDQVPVELIHIGNVRVRGDSLKLICFKEHGTQCYLCGLKATHFTLYYHTKNNGHLLILYGLDSWTKNPVEFTVDHIVPRSKGGKGDLDNVRTMCAPCNQLLGRLLIIRKELRAIRRLKKQRKLVKKVRPFKQG